MPKRILLNRETSFTDTAYDDADDDDMVSRITYVTLMSSNYLLHKVRESATAGEENACVLPDILPIEDQKVKDASRSADSPHVPAPPIPPLTHPRTAADLPAAWPVANETLSKGRKKDKQHKKQVATFHSTSGETAGQQHRLMRPSCGLVEVMPHNLRTDTIATVDVKEDVTVKAVEAFQHAADSKKSPVANAAAKWKKVTLAGIEMEMFDPRQGDSFDQTQISNSTSAADGTEDPNLVVTGSSTFLSSKPQSVLTTAILTESPAAVMMSPTEDYAPIDFTKKKSKQEKDLEKARQLEEEKRKEREAEMQARQELQMTSPTEDYAPIDFTKKKSKKEEDLEKASQLEEEKRKEKEAEMQARQELQRPESSSSFNAEKIASEAWRVAQEAVNEEPTEPPAIQKEDQNLVTSLGKDESTQSVNEVESQPLSPVPPEEGISMSKDPMTEEDLEAIDDAIELERERELLEKKRLAAEEARRQEEQRIEQEEEKKRLETERKAAERAAEITHQTGEGGVLAKAKGFDKGIGVGGKRRHHAPEGDSVKKMAAIFEVRGGGAQHGDRRDSERTKKPVKTPSQKKLRDTLRRESGLFGFDPDKLSEDAQQDSSQVTNL